LEKKNLTFELDFCASVPKIEYEAFFVTLQSALHVFGKNFSKFKKITITGARFLEKTPPYLF
jgi:hypothetical protein